MCPRMKIELIGGAIVYNGSELGPATALFAYPGEAKHIGTSGIVTCQTPARIDLLFCAGERVVGCEVKTVADLVSSHRSHRLHRQLRVLRELVDLPCLIVRGLWGQDLSAIVDATHPDPRSFWLDWVGWQTQGVYLLGVASENYLAQLLYYRKALATTGLRALAGTDRREPRERAPGWLLRRIRGIGPVQSARLLAKWPNTMAVFEAALDGRVATEFGHAIETKLVMAITT